MSGETAESKGSGAARAETSAPRRPRGSPRHRFLGRWTARLAWLAAGALVAIAALYVVRYRSLPELGPWHRIRLEQELGGRAAGEVRSLEEYLALEERLVGELAERERELGEPLIPLSRFRPGSPTNSLGHPVDWNRSHWLEPVGEPRGAALLLHGLSDSPYSLHAVAEALASRGVAVLSLRLPGHGTMPSELTRVGVDEWRTAVRVAADAVAKRAGDDPWTVVGYSNGAALALDLSLAALEGRGDPPPPRPDRLVFLSPAFAVSGLAGLARWQELVSHLPGLEKLRWSSVVAEYDPYKYNSFPLHAGAEIYRLTNEIEATLAWLAEAERLGELPPALTLQSVVDATVPAVASLERFYGRLPDNGSELVIYDVNRRAGALGFLASRVDLLLDEARRIGSFAFDVTLVTNAGEENFVEARTWPPHSTAPNVEPLGLEWPNGVYSLSHVAIPFPPDDPIYGAGERHGPFPFGNLEPRGEKGALIVPIDLLMRLRYNPFHAYLERRVASFLGLEAKVPVATPQQ